jgi:hypothetical protein
LDRRAYTMVIASGDSKAVGRTGAADQRNLGDSKGQQGITNLEVSGGSERLSWGAKPLE